MVGLDGLNLEASGIMVDINLVSGLQDGEVAAKRVVDFQRKSLGVVTGTGTTSTLTLDGAAGQTTRLVGSLVLDVFGFVKVEGDFGIESRKGQVKLAGIKDDPKTTDKDETLVDVDMLLIGGTKLKAFVGAGGVGIELKNVELGLALLTEQVTGNEKASRKELACRRPAQFGPGHQ
mgnify:CR=1 FL=1